MGENCRKVESCGQSFHETGCGKPGVLRPEETMRFNSYPSRATSAGCLSATLVCSFGSIAKSKSCNGGRVEAG